LTSEIGPLRFDTMMGEGYGDEGKGGGGLALPITPRMGVVLQNSPSSPLEGLELIVTMAATIAPASIKRRTERGNVGLVKTSLPPVSNRSRPS
jgi:hypothetical protein